MVDRSRAVAANARGNQLAHAGDAQGAEAAYRDAITLDPNFESAWFNLGLVFKRRQDWEGCRDANLRAAELDPRKEQPAWWNLGIAATAPRLAHRATGVEGLRRRHPRWRGTDRGEVRHDARTHRSPRCGRGGVVPANR